MERRDLLKAGVAVSASALLPRAAFAAPFAAPFAPEPREWRTFEIATRIELKDTKGPARAWVPLPSIAEADWIKPLGNNWNIAGGTASEYTFAPYDANLLKAEWPAGTTAPVVEVTSRVATQDRAVDLTKPSKAAPLSAYDRRLNLSATQLIPTDGIVKATADKITAGAATDLDKARRIYEWIVANTFRNPKVPGCGLGNIEFMLKTGNLGGKCADFNALFVGLARARAFRRAISTASASRRRASATRASAPMPNRSPRRSIAAPRCGWSTMAGCRPIRPMCAR